MKKLNVKRTTLFEIVKHWGDGLPRKWLNTTLFIRCNAKGIINWEKSPVYECEELIQRDNVTIIN